ncbi:MAG: cell wall-active antibiotics response protein [Clostridiales bacterium]|nr:cell wall-active antibiotics response protein [Clostridiales bacterium]
MNSKQNLTKILFGITALIAGVLLILVAFDVFTFEAIVPYWTLFIIIPTLGSMIFNGITLWKTVLLAISVNALICQEHWGDWGWRQFLLVNLAVVFILAGVYLIFGRKLSTDQRRGKGNTNQPNPYNGAGNYNNTYNNATWQNNAGNQQYYGNNTNTDQNAGNNGGNSAHQVDHSENPKYVAVFSGSEFINSSRDFKGGSATAVFGNIEVDLTDITLQRDVTFKVTALFGGAVIFVPSNVRIEANGTSLFGGCDNFAGSLTEPSVPCIRINYTAIGGKVDIKLREIERN